MKMGLRPLEWSVCWSTPLITANFPSPGTALLMGVHCPQHVGQSLSASMKAPVPSPRWNGDYCVFCCMYACYAQRTIQACGTFKCSWYRKSTLRKAAFLESLKPCAFACNRLAIFSRCLLLGRRKLDQIKWSTMIGNNENMFRNNV